MPCVVTAMSQLENDPIQNVVHSAAAAKKRKRSRKVYTDKKFVCTHESCGKSYSRAEHLYRHQLNHTPKQIYRCDFPDCYRSFVRQDLCIRHRERHTTRGSQLQKRDHFAQAASHLHGKPLVPSNAEAFSASGRNGSRLLPATSKMEQLPSPTVSDHGRPIALASSSSSPTPVGTYPSYSYPPQTGVEWSDYGFSQSTGSSHCMTSPSMQSTATYGHYAPMSGRSSPHTSVSSGELGQESQMHMQANDCVTTTGGSQNISAPYHSVTTDINGTSLVHPTSTAAMPVGSGFNHDHMSMGTAASTPATTLGGGLNTGMITAGSTVSDNFDSLSPCAYPALGSASETYNRTTPFGMADDFAAWLFNDGRGAAATATTAASATATNGMVPNYLESAQQMPNPFFLSEPSFNGVFNHMLTQHPMSVTSLLDSSSTTSSFPATQTILSPKKRRDLLHLISTRFNEAAYSTDAKRKDFLMTGDLDNDNHVLSLRMIQAYLGSYWSHMHPQLPILHLPTFIPDQTPSLLLLAMIALGASTLQDGGIEAIERAAELANFIAWHLRWELFMDADFQPPAKLWVFQALLLLEVHEKRYSTRALHERAHIHHDTTLTLMRRGSSLLTTASTTGDTDEQASWANWIQAEGRRRVAFAALMLDATHATMFGHSVKMVAHELRLPLPCDEAIWSAPSAVDVVRMKGNRQPVLLFLDGLKKTLNGETVRTNAFGRSVLMAGLLSVSWHMNQRDLQMTSLGVPQILGGRDKWRASLLRAFDNWRRDCDEPYEYARVPTEPTLDYSEDILHGLAHIASHVDIVDCQIFAGAGRLMGRTITVRDYDLAREKMIAWVTKASARDATFYALKVLTRVLGCGGGHYYSAGNDSLLHQPWVVYMAALVVWCYGYALDGPLVSSSSLSSPSLSSMAMSKSEQIQNMQDFLRRVGEVQDPNELQTVSGRNDSLGLLMVLRDSFMQQQRWELMEEAAGLLGSCIRKLYGV